MAHCDESIELISAALDGALSPEEQTRLDRHLAQCPDCKALYEDLTQIHQSLLDLPPVEVPADLTQRIMGAVAAEAQGDKVVPLPQPKKAAFPWQRWAATAAAVAVVILGARTMQGEKSADEDLLAPAQALPSAQSDLQAYSDSSIVPESDILDVDSVEPVGDDASVRSRNAEIAQVSEEPTIEAMTGQAKLVPAAVPAPSADPPSPEPSAVPEETSIPTGGVTPRTAMGMVPPPTSEGNSDLSSKEKTDDPVPEGQVSPSTFAIQSLPSEEPPLLPVPTDEPTETAVPNNMLLTSIGNGLVSVDDEPEETLPLTPREALDLLLEAQPMPEDAQIVDNEDFLGWQTPYCGEPDSQQVSIRLQYRGLTENRSYHEFCLYDSFIDSPGDEERPSILNFFAVPMVGGEVLVQRQDVEGDLHDEDVWNTYLAGIDAYREATRYLEPSEAGEGSLPPSESPQP